MTKKFTHIVLFFVVVFSLALLFLNNDNIRTNHPNQCAMTYFNQELIPQQYAHPFYELAQYRLSNPLITTAYEMYTNDQKLLDKATKKSFPTHPTPAGDEVQHLMFFFPGNAGNRWQVRSLGTKLDNYIGKLYRQTNGFSFEGSRPRVPRFEPGLTEMSPRVSHLFSTLSHSQSFRSPKAFYSKFSKVNITNDLGETEELWHDATSEFNNQPNFEDILSLNDDPTMPTMLQTNYIDNHLYTFNFNEQMGAFSGLTLEAQQEYAVYAITRIVARSRRQYFGKIQVSLIGHSMGGVVALSSVEQLNSAFLHEKYENVAISSVITFGSPVTPLYIPDYHSARIYDEGHRFINNHEACSNLTKTAQFPNNNNDLLCNIALSQFDGDTGDAMVPRLYSGSHRFQYNNHTLALSTAEISSMRLSAGHDALAFCGQMMETVAMLLLRKVLLDSITVSKLDLDNHPSESLRLPHYLRRPDVIYIPHPSNLLFKSYDKMKRLEFAPILTRSLPRHLLPKQADNVFELDQRVIQPDSDNNDFVITYADITAHVDGLLYDSQDPQTSSRLNTSIPPLTRSISLTTLTETHGANNAFMLASEFHATFQLCPKNSPLSQCVSLQNFRHAIDTPHHAYLNHKNMHTVRAASSFSDKVLSRSSRWNQENDKLPGDPGFIEPLSTSLSQHGSVTIFTFSQLYTFSQTKLQFKGSYEQFVKYFNLQLILSPAVLEGIVGIPNYLEIPSHLINLDEDWTIPIVWSSIQTLPKSTIVPTAKHVIPSQLFKYQLTLGDSTTHQPISPTIGQCTLIGSLLVSEFAFPIVSLDISILYTVGIAEPTFHIAQTHQFSPKSPFIACVQTFNQRFLQAAPSNAMVDIVLGYASSRHPQAQKIDYDTDAKKSIPLFSEASLGALPIPSSLIDNISGSVHIVNPPPTAPRISQEIFLLPEALDKPYLPRFVRTITFYLLSLHFPLVSFSIQLAILFSIWNFIKYHRDKRFLSSFIDYYEDKDVKKAVYGMKYSPIASHDASHSTPSSHIVSLSDDEDNNQSSHNPTLTSSHESNDSGDESPIEHTDIKPLLPQAPPPRLMKKHKTQQQLQQQTTKQIKPQQKCKSITNILKPFLRFSFAAAIAGIIVLCVLFPFIYRSNPVLHHTIPAPIFIALQPLLETHHLVVQALQAAHIPEFIEAVVKSIQVTLIPIFMQVFHIFSPIVLPTLHWCYSWVSWVEYLFNHSASPVAMLRPQSEIDMTDNEFYTAVIIYYFLAFCFAQIVIYLLNIIKTVLSFPFATYVAFNGTLFGMLQDIFFPLALLFGYAIPLLVLFLYSISSVFTQFFRSTYLGANLAHTAFARSIVHFHVTVHCFCKQGIYYFIHHTAQFLLSIFKSPSSFVVVNMNQYPKYHIYPQTITYLQHVLSDFELYTKPSVLSEFQCMVHPEDYQLLPIPISTATILFFSVLSTLFVVLFVSILTSYDFKQYKSYLSKYYDKQEAQIKANGSTGTENEDDAEQHYLLSRILHRDWKLSSMFASKRTFLMLFFVVILSVLMIFPSCRVISESTELSMKQNQYRQLYQQVQSQTITQLELQTRLDRVDITRTHFNTYATESVSFSIFYSFLTKFYPSQQHNPYAKYLLTAQWYQQRSVWSAIVPTDLITHLNFYTTFVFTFLLAVQLAAILSYFIYLDNTKLRAIEFIRSLKATVLLGSNPIPRIQRNPHNFQLLVRFVYIASYVLTAVFTSLVILPIFIPWLLNISGELSSQSPDVYINNFSYRILQTPYQQSLICLPLLFSILLHLIYLSFDLKLVIPNEVNRPFKHNPVE